MKHKLLAAFFLLSTVAVTTGCDRPADDPVAAHAPAAGAVAPPPPPLDRPLDTSKLDVRMVLVDKPHAEGGGALVVFGVRIDNAGPEALSPSGTFPVNLGIALIDMAGKVVTRDFARVKIPFIATGGVAHVRVELPAAQLDGHGVLVELVQEEVTWFGDVGKPGIIVGPFHACAKTPGQLCLDAHGQ
jgi:hypothetical protein